MEFFMHYIPFSHAHIVVILDWKKSVNVYKCYLEQNSFNGVSQNALCAYVILSQNDELYVKKY